LAHHRLGHASDLTSVHQFIEHALVHRTAQVEDHASVQTKDHASTCSQTNIAGRQLAKMHPSPKEASNSIGAPAGNLRQPYCFA